MSNRAERVVAFIGLFMRPEFVKFVIVGCINTALTLVLFWLLLNALHWNYAAALTVTWMAGILFNYCFNSVWSFRTAARPSFDAKFVRYVLVYIAAFFLNLGLLTLLVEALQFSPMVGQFVAMPPVVAFNYLGARFWALRGFGSNPS